MEFCNLASGSKGNCTYVATDNTAILVDEGISFKALITQCKTVGIDLSKLDAIVITHEHIDHIKGVDMATNQLNIPVYIQPRSLQVAKCKFGAFNHALEEEFIRPICIKDLEITAFRVSHDAAYTQGFSISDGKKNFVMATDLGYVPDAVYKRLAKSDYLYLESNYDEGMLFAGSYPYRTKLRIESNEGHLSNAQTSVLASRLVKDGVNRFMLAHLSQNNNTEEKAVETLLGEFVSQGIKREDVELAVANQINPSRIITI